MNKTQILRKKSITILYLIRYAKIKNPADFIENFDLQWLRTGKRYGMGVPQKSVNQTN
jgi:hypothetical protein